VNRKRGEKPLCCRRLAVMASLVEAGQRGKGKRYNHGTPSETVRGVMRYEMVLVSVEAMCRARGGGSLVMNRGMGMGTFRVRAMSALGGEAVDASDRGVDGVDGQGMFSRGR